MTIRRYVDKLFDSSIALPFYTTVDNVICFASPRLVRATTRPSRPAATPHTRGAATSFSTSGAMLLSASASAKPVSAMRT